MTVPHAADPPRDDGRVEQARGGDVAAFTALLREHDAAMRALVWSMVRDSWLMDDVLQQAYERAWKALPGFRGDSSFGTWLHRICWTSAVDVLRSESRRPTVGWPEPGHDDLPVTTPGPEARVVTRLTFADAWQTLPAEQRTALTLVAGQGLPYAEAARICGTTEGTIAARVSRGRATLKATLARADRLPARDRPTEKEGPR